LKIKLEKEGNSHNRTTIAAVYVYLQQVSRILLMFFIVQSIFESPNDKEKLRDIAAWFTG
jgi:uncharacterized membrane-anchored protein